MKKKDILRSIPKCMAMTSFSNKPNTSRQLQSSQAFVAFIISEFFLLKIKQNQTEIERKAITMIDFYFHLRLN